MYLSSTATLFWNSVSLAVGSAAIALPLGIYFGFLLARRTFAWSHVFSAVLIFAALIPLPVYAVACQVVLGDYLPSMTLQPGQISWRAWQAGVFPSAIVHGFAAIPAITGLSYYLLKRTDPNLEEFASMNGGKWEVYRRVLFPKLKLAVFAGMIWMWTIALTEICVTDAMMLRTYAEEVYTLIISDYQSAKRAVWLAIPPWLISVGITFLAFRRIWQAEDSIKSTKQKQLPRGHTAFIWLIVLAIYLLPLLALSSKTTSKGSLLFFQQTMLGLLIDSGIVVLQSLAMAILTGFFTVIFAWLLILYWPKRRLNFLILLALLIWMMPGPVCGFALKQTIFALMDLEDWLLRLSGMNVNQALFRSWFYEQPSPLPAIWASVIRLMPFSIAIILPSYLAIPAYLNDLARLDGLTWFQKWKLIYKPHCLFATCLAGIIVSALSLGEISASKVVNPPGHRSFILDLFNQMHYGAEAGVAGLCLIQMAMIFLALVFGRWLIKPYFRPLFPSKE